MSEDMSICEVSIEVLETDDKGERLLNENKSCEACDFTAKEEEIL